jgi:hypothetical protein
MLVNPLTRHFNFVWDLEDFSKKNLVIQTKLLHHISPTSGSAILAAIEEVLTGPYYP